MVSSPLLRHNGVFKLEVVWLDDGPLLCSSPQKEPHSIASRKARGKKSLLAAKTAIVDGERPEAMRRTGEANKKVNISLI